MYQVIRSLSVLLLIGFSKTYSMKAFKMHCFMYLKPVHISQRRRYSVRTL